VEKLLARSLVVAIVKRIGAELLGVDLQKLHAISPIHVQGLAKLTDDFSVLRPFHTPINLVQDSYVGSFQYFNILRYLLRIHPSDPLSVLLRMLALLSNPRHEALLVGQKELNIVEFEPPFNVPKSNTQRRAKPRDFERTRSCSTITGLIVNERSLKKLYPAAICAKGGMISHCASPLLSRW